MFKSNGLLAAILVFLITSIAVTGCSNGTPKADGDESAQDVAALEAPTDAVPQDSVEAPAAPAPDPAKDVAATVPPPAPEVATAPPAAESTPPLPESAPPVAPEVAAAPAPAAQGTESYTTQKGDTLMKIAFETYGDLFQWRKVYEMNKEKISDPNALSAGIQLTVEKKAGVSVAHNGDQYTIKKGDTLGTISSDVYGTPQKWKRLWENNKQLIHNPNKIFAGFSLYYTMSPEDVEFKKSHGSQPAPLAKAQSDQRDPASVQPKKKHHKHKKKAAKDHSPAAQ